MNVALSEKDRKFREFALEGSMWKVIWKVFLQEICFCY